MEEYDPTLPPIRYELSFHQPSVPGDLFVQDPKGYIPDHFMLKEEVLPFLRFFDGSKSLSSLVHAFNHIEGIDAFAHSLINQLDKALLLDSIHFKNESTKLDQDFESSEQLHARFTGSSFPDESTDWPTYFNLHPAKEPLTTTGVKPLMVFAPHIDFRVERKLYTKTFNLLKSHQYKYILCIGTSHFAGYYPTIYDHYPFICSSKGFKSAFGKLNNDRAFFEYLNQLAQPKEYGIQFKDRAFRTEHAIEYHLILSQLIWGNNFHFLPILVASLHDILYAENGYEANQLSKTAELIAQFLLKERNLNECLILVSGDLAHFGPRFGGSIDAKDHEKNIEGIDSRFLHAFSEGNQAEIFKSIQEHFDQYNHCGYPPAMLALKILDYLNIDTTGKVVGRDFWYDQTDQSTVSYGSSIIYHDKN